MTPFMHIVRTKRLLLSLAGLAYPDNPYRPRITHTYTYMEAANWGPYRVLSTSGNRRRDSKVRLAAAEATLVCG